MKHLLACLLVALVAVFFVVPAPADTLTYSADTPALDVIAEALVNVANNGDPWSVNVISVDATSYTVGSTTKAVAVSHTDTAAVSVILPTAQMVSGRALMVIDSGGSANTHNITISTEGTEKINGADTSVINAAYGVVRLISDGVGWFKW